MGTKHKDADKYIHIFTLLHTELQCLINKPNFSQQQLRDTNQQQAAL